MPAVFIPQSMLDAWADQGKVELADTTLHLLQEQRSVDLNPAVRFLSVIGDEDDPHRLKGKVKTIDQLKEMGAEHYMDSVILGDVGYQVVEGFMGDLTKPAADAAEQSSGHERAVTMPPMPAVPKTDVAQRVDDKAAPLPIDLPSSPPSPAEGRSAEGIEGAVAEAIDDTGEDQTESDAEALSRLFLETVQ